MVIRLLLLFFLLTTLFQSLHAHEHEEQLHKCTLCIFAQLTAASDTPTERNIDLSEVRVLSEQQILCEINFSYLNPFSFSTCSRAPPVHS